MVGLEVNGTRSRCFKTQKGGQIQLLLQDYTKNQRLHKQACSQLMNLVESDSDTPEDISSGSALTQDLRMMAFLVLGITHVYPEVPPPIA